MANGEARWAGALKGIEPWMQMWVQELSRRGAESRGETRDIARDERIRGRARESALASFLSRQSLEEAGEPISTGRQLGYIGEAFRPGGPKVPPGVGPAVDMTEVLGQKGEFIKRVRGRPVFLPRPLAGKKGKTLGRTDYTAAATGWRTLARQYQTQAESLELSLGRSKESKELRRKGEKALKLADWWTGAVSRAARGLPIGKPPEYEIKDFPVDVKTWGGWGPTETKIERRVVRKGARAPKTPSRAPQISQQNPLDIRIPQPRR